MKLNRYAVIYLERSSQDWHKEFPLTDDGSIHIEKIEPNPNIPNRRYLIVAKVTLKYLPKVKDDLVVIPTRERKHLEQKIEEVAQFISVVERQKVDIFSPHPCVALSISNPNDAKFINGLRGIFNANRRSRFVNITFKVNIDSRVRGLIAHRTDGLALLSESISHQHATGKYHEYIRIFERAFKISGKQLVNPLIEFLESNEANLGYTKPEILSWLKKRDAATHADQRNDFALKRDLEPMILRMEQAAYDVVFNKKDWRSKNTDRIQTLKFLAGTTSEDSDMFLVKGKGASISFRHLDEFRVFSKKESPLKLSLPKNHWSGSFIPGQENPNTIMSFSGRVTVIEEEQL